MRSEFCLWEKCLVGLAALVVLGVLTVTNFRPQLLQTRKASSPEPMLRAPAGPPPVLAPGPEQTMNGHKLTSWVVTWAGVPQANGVYTRTGTYNGQPAYRNANGLFWLFSDQLGRYFITRRQATPRPDLGLYCASESGLPGGIWRVAQPHAPFAGALKLRDEATEEDGGVPSCE